MLASYHKRDFFFKFSSFVRIEEDWYDWWERHHESLKIKKEVNPEIILLGDSLTHMWGGLPLDERNTGQRALDEFFGEFRVLNLGFGWDRTQNVIWRITHGELDHLDPNYIVLNVGTNNLV